MIVHATILYPPTLSFHLYVIYMIMDAITRGSSEDAAPQLWQVVEAPEVHTAKVLSQITTEKVVD